MDLASNPFVVIRAWLSVGIAEADAEAEGMMAASRHFMYQRILAAVDLSEASANALREARNMAASNGAALAIVHVLPDFVDLRTMHPRAALDSLPGLEAFAARARERIAAWMNEANHDPATELFLEQGSAATRIIERAESWKADLIVLGHQGHTGLAELLLGSVAMRVVHAAHCPVLVTRRSGAGHGAVIGATDLSDPSIPAISSAAAEARRRGVELDVVHVVDRTTGLYAASVGSFFGLSVPLPPSELAAEVQAALLSTLEQTLVDLGTPGKAQVLYGSPADAVIRFAQESGADLVVVGTHGRTELRRRTMGSTADEILRGAPCSVLVVRHSVAAAS
jgi:nucleotide-binding universal stress UspA family protein